MKQTALQWLYDQIGDSAPYEYAGQIAEYFDQAFKIEKEQNKATPELPDEEIEKAAEKITVYMKDFIVGAKWYREQLKQRQ